MDPLTLALIVGASLWLTDTSLSGLLRAELGGGARGGARGAASTFWGRRKTASERRRKRRNKSAFGRFVNAVLDETGSLLRGFGSGWRDGRRKGHERRRERWAKKPPWWKRVFGPSDPKDKVVDDPERPPEQTPSGDPERPEDPEEVVEPAPEDDPEREPEREPEHQESEPPENDGTNVPTERGPIIVSDLTSAPAVIAAWEELAARFEQLQAETDELATTAGQLRDGAGDFATGTEGDAADSVQAIHDAITYAKERVQVTVDALHEEWDQHIAAAEGRTAAAHSPFQEV